MRRVRGIAHQHDVVVVPALARDAREVEPGRAAPMRGVADQPLAVEISLEQHLAGGDAVLLAHLVEAETLPGRRIALDDEGRGVGIEAVGVRPEPAVLGLLEDEGEGFEDLVRAEPDVLVPAQLEARPEGGGVLVPDPAVDAVRRDDEVGVTVGPEVLDLGFELQLDAKLPRPRLQDVEQPLACDAGEAVAAGAHDMPLEVDVDVVPVLKGVLDRGRALGVVLPQVVEGLVGEDHAPAEGVVGAVALEHQHLVRRVAQLHRDRKVQPGRPAADAHDLHATPSRRPAPQ